jgi:hypothetical protein
MPNQPCPPSITRNCLRRSGAVGVGLGGAAPRAASINLLIDHTCHTPAVMEGGEARRLQREEDCS